MTVLIRIAQIYDKEVSNTLESLSAGSLANAIWLPQIDSLKSNSEQAMGSKVFFCSIVDLGTFKIPFSACLCPGI